MSLNKVKWGQYPTGCGWWCRRAHDLLDVVEFSASIYSASGGQAGNMVLGIAEGLNDQFGNGKILELDMTSADEKLTDKWSKEEFSPYLLGLALKIDTLKKKQITSNDIYLISLLLGEICTVIHYYTNNSNPLLSQKVNDELGVYVNHCLQPMRNEILKLVPISSDKYIAKYNFIGLPKPLVESGTLLNKKFICEIYTAKGMSSNVPDAIALTESDIYFTNVPAINMNSTSSSSTNVDPMNAELEPKPQTQTQTQTQENQASTPPKSSSNILGWLLAAFIGYKILK